MNSNKEFDYKAFEHEAIKQLQSGLPLSGKNDVLAPLLKRLLEAGMQGKRVSWMMTIYGKKRRPFQIQLRGVKDILIACIDSLKGCHSSLTQNILLMPIRGIDIRDISVIENVSVKKILSVSVNPNRIITPKQQHYDSLEVGEFRTYVASKKHKVWLIYAYHRSTNEIVAYV